MSRRGEVHARFFAALARLTRPVRQGPSTGAGPWRARPEAGAAHDGATVPVVATIPSQGAQPAAAFPYLAAFIEGQDGQSAMWVRGELDAGSQARLRNAIAAARNRPGPRGGQ